MTHDKRARGRELSKTKLLRARALFLQGADSVERVCKAVGLAQSSFPPAYFATYGEMPHDTIAWVRLLPRSRKPFLS